MKIYQLLLVTLLTLSFVGLVPSFEGSPATPTVYLIGYGWGSPSNPINVHPGYTDFPFYVELVAYDATPLSATISFPPPPGTTFYVPPFTAVSSNQAGVSQANGNYVSTFYLTVSNTTSPGYYTVKVTVCFAYTIADSQVIGSRSFTLEVPVSAVNFPTPVAIQGGTPNNVEVLTQGEGLVPVTLEVSNPSQHVVSNVMINVTLPKGLYNQMGQDYVTFAFPSIQPQSTQYDTQMMNVTQGAVSGTYTLNYTITFMNYLGYRYFATNQNLTSGNANVTLNRVPLTLSLYPKMPVKFSATSTSTTPSSTFSIMLELNSPYDYLIQSVTPQSQFSLVKSNFTPATFQGFQTFNYTFSVPQNEIPGVYPVTFTVNYQVFGQSQQALVTTYVTVNYYNLSPSLSTPVWGEQGNQIVPMPGLTGIPLTLTLSNPLPYAISEVNATLIFPQGINSTYDSYLIPEVQAYGATTLTLVMNLGQNVSPGYHTLNYVLTYASSYGISRVEGSLPVYIYPENQISVSFANSTVYQGTESILPITIENLGAPLSSVSVNLKTSGLNLVGFSNETLTYLGSGESSTFTFLLSAQGVGVGTYPAVLTVSYNYGGVTKVSNYVIPINVVSSQNLVSVSLEPGIVYYGQVNNLTLKLTDLSQVPLTDVSVKVFGNPTLYSISQTTLNLGTVDPGKTTSFTLQVLPSVTSTTPLPISVQLQYVVPGGVVTQGYNFSLIATGSVVLQLQQPTVSFSNGSLTVNGVLNNFGSTSANFVTVYVNGNSTYIGSVPPNSPTPFSLTLPLFFNGNGTGHPLHLRIIISYEDAIYQSHNLTYSLNFSPTFNTNSTFHNFHQFRVHRASILPELIIFLVIIIVIVIAIFLVLRRGRK
ncbi:hypothetical protein GWK48_01260 [Metallosphaera tengchongensis]|uniref:S-layer protein n=1 Tax=Metallosphaera tengchongensis TaxID=1532350 RepID=A0A6N0NSX5_9CREN|nr:hypothetical protein [Metallosphaera tengchongensis]QKQ99206.1 hypothetical protein GWK48_01260 [Metallosphaera tengchongensis]